MQGYLPRELEVLDSKYGTEAELRSCIAALKASDVVAIADVVVNHRCAGKQACGSPESLCLYMHQGITLQLYEDGLPAVQDEAGRWNVFTGRYSWDASCVCSNDPQYGGTGAAKTTAGFDCAPNIDHANPRVRQVKGSLYTGLMPSGAQSCLVLPCQVTTHGHHACQGLATEVDVKPSCG